MYIHVHYMFIISIARQPLDMSKRAFWLATLLVLRLSAHIPRVEKVGQTSFAELKIKTNVIFLAIQWLSIYIIKQLFHSISSYMADSQRGASTTRFRGIIVKYTWLYTSLSGRGWWVVILKKCSTTFLVLKTIFCVQNNTLEKEKVRHGKNYL